MKGVYDLMTYSIHFSECVALQDPYCAWDKTMGACRSVASSRGPDEKFFFQNIANGSTPFCPGGNVYFLFAYL